MLSELKIENVAVIEKATVAFGNGFNVLTGETGAGKSILIDSINAILGNRASRDLVRSHTPKASIWATFTGLGIQAEKLLAAAGYPVENELLLYREISAEGKSVCRINGMPATAAVLREVCAGLINIHGQHDNQSLMNPANHIHILDAFAQNRAQHDAYYKVYRELVSVKKQLDALNMNEEEKLRRVELLRFQINELQAADVQVQEEETLLEQRNKLRNAQAIREQLALAYTALNGTDDSAGSVQMLGDAATALEAAAQMAGSFAPLAERLQELYYTAKEAASDVNDITETTELDPQQLEETEERLNEIYRLKEKYGTDAAGLQKVLADSEEELHNIEFSEQKLDELYEKQDALYTKAKQLAEALTQSRLKAYENFNAQISEALQFLNMPGIRFELRHSRGPLAGAGQDTVEFYTSTNAGEEPKPLAKIASGGELSRIMLAVKSALADKDEIATVIYDEIDTGVSGSAAGRIGEKLRQTSVGRQVICITHTAQIAALADNHLLIKKNVENERTYTEIHPLDKEGRVAELAKMVAGDKVTELALANAREMLANA